MMRIFAKLIEPRRDRVPIEGQLFSNDDLRSLIVPLIIEQILVMFVGVADTMMVSQAGMAAISGVSLVDMINGVFIYLFNALATGGTIVVSQYIGSRDLVQGRRSANQLITITALLSLAFFGIVMVGDRRLLRFLFGGIEEDIMTASATYLRITAYSYPFMALYSACAALFRSMGSSKVTMKVSLCMNVINVAGNAISVFVLDAGVTGIAVASLAARAAAAVAMLWMLSDRGKDICIEVRHILSWDGGLLKKILSIAIPSSVESATFQVTRVALTSLVAAFGTAQIAANGVAISIDNINTIVNSAVGMAMPTVIGRCVGALDYRQATYYTRKMLRIAQFGSLAINLTLFALLPWILSLYALSDEARWYAGVLVAIHTAWTILLGTSSGPLPSALRAAGDAKFTMIVAVAGLLIGRLFGSILFAVYFDMGIIGLWVAMGTHWVFNSAFGYMRFMNGKWKTKRIV